MAKKIACSLALICTFYILLPAQATLSPYSRYGLGNLFDATSTRDFSMGGIGIGNYNRSTVNRINPASYGDLRLTTLDFSTYGGYVQQKDNNSSYSSGIGGFHNLSLGFANRKNWGLVVGLAPYSTTNYNVVTNSTVQVDSVLENAVTTYSATGGLNRFYGGFGAKFFGRVNLGVNLSYAFGNTVYDWENNFDNTAYQTVNVEKRVSLNGLLPQFGIQYGDTLKFNVTIDKMKELEKGYKDLEGNLANIADAKKDRLKDQEDLAKEKAKKEPKRQEIITEKEAATDRVKQLSDENESANRKEIGKLQEKAFRLEKKRKKMDRYFKVEERKIATDLNRLDAQMGKVRNRQEVNLKQQEAIRQGKAPATGKRTSRIIFRVGGVVETPASLNGERVVRFDNGAIFDTLGTVTNGTVQLPLKYGTGFTIGKPFRWTVGADVSFQDWTKFQYFDETTNLRSAMNVNVGGAWIPKLTSSKYFRRTSYRGGFYLKNTQLNVQGNPLTEWGITAGLGLPMGFFNPAGLSYSRINIGFSYGKRGSLSSGNLMEESVIMMRLGVNLNDLWFIKRVVD